MTLETLEKRMREFCCLSLLTLKSFLKKNVPRNPANETRRTRKSRELAGGTRKSSAKINAPDSLAIITWSLCGWEGERIEEPFSDTVFRLPLPESQEEKNGEEEWNLKVCAGISLWQDDSGLSHLA